MNFNIRMPSTIRKRFMAIKNQLLVILIGNICSINSGILIGWIAPILDLLRSHKSPLTTGPITVEDQSWIGSAELIGVFLGPFVYSYIANNFGRKVAILMISIPTVLGVLFMIFGNNVDFLVLYRVITGISIGGTFLLIPMLVTEISDDHIRGAFGSMLTIFQYTGLLIGNIIGTYTPFQISSLSLFVCPLLIWFTFTLFPESPVYLYSRKNEKAGDKSLKFYKNCADDIQKFNIERNKIDQILEKLNDGTESQITNNDICTGTALKGFLIGITVTTLSTCTGVLTLSVYAVVIFRDSGSTLDPHESTMIMSTIQLIGSICAAIFCDRIGRKILLIVSLFGCVIGQLSMGVFAYLGSNGYDISSESWISVVSMSIILFASSVGVAPLRHVVSLEVIPPKLRSIAIILNNAILCITQFIVFKFFPILSESFGLHTTMWGLCVACSLGIIFCMFVIQETKGKNVNS